jgi:hypothetical protein
MSEHIGFQKMVQHLSHEKNPPRDPKAGTRQDAKSETVACQAMTRQLGKATLPLREIE